jgi:hypothetical protein
VPLSHGGAPDDAVGVLGRLVVAKHCPNVTEPAQIKGTLNHLFEVEEVNWLEKILECPSLHRLNRCLRVRMCRDDDYRSDCNHFLIE